MAKCIITKKKNMTGNKISKSNKKTKKKFKINIKKKKIFDLFKSKFINLKITTKGIKILDKITITQAIKKYNKI